MFASYASARSGTQAQWWGRGRAGEAVCTQELEGESVVVGRLMTGGYFGEIALLTSKPRQATVSAKGELVTLSLDRATFTRVMGPLIDVLNRNIGTYTEAAHF